MGVRLSNLKSEIYVTSDFSTRPTESNSVSYIVTRGTLVTSAWWPLGREYCDLAHSVISTIVAAFFLLTYLDIN